MDEYEIQEIQNSIEDYLKKNNMKNIEVDVQRTESTGNNYVSIILKATSKSEKNGQVFEEKYVIKQTKNDNRFGNQPMENLVWDWSKSEQYVYVAVFPAMTELQKKYNVKSDFRVAEYVNALVLPERQFIIFKDLTLTGYTLRDRNLMMDTDHVSIVLRRLAEFHAFSMALKHLDPEKYRAVTAINLQEKLFKVVPFFTEFFDNSADLQFAAIIERIKDQQIRRKLLKIKECFPEICRKLAKDDHAAPYSVIGHGDLWNNNIMFNYKDKKPVDAILLDWQVMRHNSPVLDLLHLITTSVDESLQNSEGFDFVINTYYENLSEELEKYSLNSNIVYPKNIYWNHLRTYTPLGLRICTVMWPYHCRMYDDTVTASEMMNDIQKTFDMSTASKKRYEKMWDFLLDVFNKNGMLDL